MRNKDKFTFLTLAALTLTCVGCPQSPRRLTQQDVPSLSPEEFALWVQAIRPSSNELKWQQIPWVRSLVEARQTARDEGRPLFLWVLDDEPFDRC